MPFVGADYSATLRGDRGMIRNGRVSARARLRRWHDAGAVHKHAGHSVRETKGSRMTKTQNPAPVAIDGTTAYVAPVPDGIGATVELALSAAGGERVRHVVVTGARPGGTDRRQREWVAASGEWFATSEPYVAPSTLRVTLAGGGRQVHVSRAEPWFGVDAEPDVCGEAMRVLRHVAAGVGVRASGTPGRTGLAMLRAGWTERGQVWGECPTDVAELLRATSGQGRFQLFDAGRQGHRLVVGVDARFQYAALATMEMPVGEPEHVNGIADADKYLPAWCQVEFTPAGGPFGLLGVMGDQLRGWTYPTTGGPYVAWCSGAELMLAEQHGYRCRVLQAYVWRQRARPLAAWAGRLIREREHVATLPLRPAVVAAVRAGHRGMVIQAVGMMHGRPPARQCIAGTPAEIPAEARAIRRDGDVWRYQLDGTPAAGAIIRPDWSTRIWSLARYRLAANMLAQRRTVIACALDGFYVAGEPDIAADDGRAGRWRESGRWSNVPACESLADLYAVTRG